MGRPPVVAALAAAVVLATAVTAQGQVARVTGTVRDEAGKPLKGATVTAYVERAPRVWVELGHDHPLAGQIKPAEGQALLLKPGDTLAIPVFAWHQYFNDGDEPLRILAQSTRPAMENLGLVLTQQGELANY